MVNVGKKAVSASRAGFSQEARRVGESWRKSTKPTSALPGLFTGRVMDDGDPENMGRVRVFVFNYSGSKIDPNVEEPPLTTWLTFQPVFPFAGSSDGTERDSGGYSQSYGMWYHPRRGDHVAVMFADSDKADGYYLGCVPKWGQNHQLPGAAVGRADGEEFAVPVSEQPEGSRPGDRNTNYSLSQNLKQSGLQNDIFRGGSTSGARRESPSRVVGIKSPGDPSNSQIGHQFIMDDLPENQGVRIRTSAGHQILFSDVGKFVYISTARGDTWIELSQDGHVDVFGAKDISLHAERDFNVIADRDINLQAGRDLNLLVGEDVKAHVGRDYDLTVEGDKKTSVSGDQHWTSSGDTKMTAGGNLDSAASGALKIGAGGAMDLSSGGVMRQHSNASLRTQNGATAPTAATAATDVNSTELPGPPTRSDILKAAPGGEKAYLAGRDNNFRVPQHEPWPTKNFNNSSPQRVTQPSKPRANTPLVQKASYTPDTSNVIIDRDGKVQWDLVNRVDMNGTGHRRIEGVHPDLVRVVELASTLSTQPFFVYEGLRTVAKQRDNYSRGYSKTMNSRHLTGHAVDLLPTVEWGGSVTGALTTSNFNKIADAMFAAAEQLGVAVEWGGNWRTFLDQPHWQLPWKQYAKTSNPNYPPPGWSEVTGWT